MANIDVINLQGETVGSIELDDAIFGAEVKPHLHWEVVRWQRAKARAGTHLVKTKSERSGTGAKPYRQKGTGNASPRFATFRAVCRWWPGAWAAASGLRILCQQEGTTGGSSLGLVSALC